MRSQYIKIRNIPEAVIKSARTVRVKPWGLLIGLFLLGSVLIAVRSYTLGVAVPIMVLTLFSMVAMPDRILVQFASDYLIMYNRQDRSECTILYWDEILSWQYEYHRSSDLLVVELTDGRTESVDMYSKFSIRRYMEAYAPGKEVKSVRRKKA